MQRTAQACSLGTALSAAALLAACGSGSDAPPSQFESRPASETYTVRGVVAQEWTQGDTLVIQHEPIHHFVNADGAAIGMNSMAMEFPEIADGVSLAGVAPGASVEFDMEVLWNPVAYRITRLERIDASGLDLVGSADPAQSQQTDRHPAQPHVYTVRGRIQQLPDPELPASDFVVQHEEITGFKDAAGDAVGMEAMAMPFPTLAEGVTLDGFAVGDVIEMVFVVTYDGTAPRYPVVRIAPLPADTELNFGG